MLGFLIAVSNVGQRTLNAGETGFGGRRCGNELATSLRFGF
jgi:hypothetical protein